MSKIFQKNISALMEKDKNLALKLLTINPTNFEVVQQGEDNINLNIIDKKKAYPIYETSPLKEIEEKEKKFKKYSRYPVLFLYGIGNGIFTKLLFANPSLKKVVVFEPNLEILYIAFHIVDFSNEILNEKIKFFIPKDVTYAKALSICSDKEIQLFLKTYELHIYSNYYEKFFSDEIINLNKTLIRAIKQTIINFGNDTIDTLIGIEHHIKNLPEMIKNPAFQQLKNKKNSEIAIIVSTGPSLAKQLPLLKEIQDYVTIISVDASLPILAKHNIKPDFVTSLERVELTGKFFENTPKEFQKDIIMVHASLQHERVLNNSHGKKVLVMRPFRYNYYYNLHNYGYLGRGMSAANMAYELATFMNYKTITLIGQDLAYSEDGTSHAKGHVLGEDEVKFKESDEYVTKYGGNGEIRTTKVWNMFRNFFEKDIENSIKEGVKTYNCTEGGARINGAIEMPFKEFIQKNVSKNKKTKITLRKPPKKSINKKIENAYKKTIKMIEYGEKIQKKVEKVFLEVAKECDIIEKIPKDKLYEKLNTNKIIKLTQKIDKIKDIIESRKFSLLYGETIQSYLVNKELDLAKIMVRDTNTDNEKKQKLIDWLFEHKEWLFMLAGSINAQIITIKRALPNLQNELQK
ncbi:motility associated factor glycosyltransferase family protein [Caminibacter mediatlanticus TB-2]|uniref:Motility associated factor glycosyltransferase family protein n=1 Tax=Caminibacter mediatlanticus TB-2 TaxID=391592 RepID=A0ABX5V6X0_9BACT|nr:motility associated factor glycosyltransferase family protein [Caminibacter mediatlanticus]QCT94010.1 motility associated factor glycosyltransferase family protein [Caminibacter mediatlanticus TB-2]